MYLLNILVSDIIFFIDFDDGLLHSLGKQQHSGVCVRKMQCRLRIQKIMDVHGTGAPLSSQHFLRMWHVAARALFGDESISLRHGDAMLDIIGDTSRSPEQQLATYVYIFYEKNSHKKIIDIVSIYGYFFSKQKTNRLNKSFIN